jgi:O-antigen/teichoic acid export membrane protein
VRNSIALMTARLVPLALSLVKVAVLSRVLGVDIFGSYSLIVAWALIGELAIFTGVRIVIPRETARHPERARAYLGASWFAASVLGGLGVIVGWLAAGWIYGASELADGLRLATLALIPSALVAGGEAVFAGLERMGIIARDAIADAITVSVASVAIVLLGGGVLQLAGAIVIGRLVALASLGAAVRCHVGAPRWDFDAAELRRTV